MAELTQSSASSAAVNGSRRINQRFLSEFSLVYLLIARSSTILAERHHFLGLGMATKAKTSEMKEKAKNTKKIGEEGRSTFSPALILALCAEVEQQCPNCPNPLFRRKGGRSYRDFEIAHIYPLNPKPDELILLRDEERLATDTNHQHNLIPLCYSCHNIYDNPKTIDGYRDLVGKKKKIIAEQGKVEIFHQHTIEEEIKKVINSLLSSTLSVDNYLSYEAKKVDEKIHASMRPLTKSRIKSDVTMFYPFIKSQFAEVERSFPTKGMLIAHQVKGFYLKQKSLSLNQQEIYQNTVDWLVSKIGNSSREAANVVASFFVQNCELFE